MAALIKLITLTHAGITTEEFDTACRSWLASARHPRSGTDQILAAAAEHKWTVIDMATDWATIHPDA